MLKYLLLASPILLVLGIAIYSIWALQKRRKEKIQTKIQKSGDRGEEKVQTTLQRLEKIDKRYKIYHNIKLGPDINHTNEYDTVIVGPNAIFHIETKNYGGERGGLIDIDSRGNWILHKKNGYSKMLVNPVSQVNSHEYRLQGFLYRRLGLKNIPTRGIIVLSCDHTKYRLSNKMRINIPILNRREIIKFIKEYKEGQKFINSHTINEICKEIELMNNI